MPIFNGINDIGLLYLASSSHRFEVLARAVFSKRYTDKYFVVEGESKRDQEIYWGQFKYFGSYIKAVKANNIRNIDKNHWMTKMLCKHSTNLEKLSFYKCFFKNGLDLLQQHMAITHLTIHGFNYDDSEYVRLPKYRNLKKLEVNYFRRITLGSLKKVFRHNPQLESLIIRYCDHYFSLPQIMSITHKHLMYLKEWCVLENFDLETNFPYNKRVEKFLHSVNGLDLLGFSIDGCEYIDKLILQRLANSCRDIKRLELNLMGGYLGNDMLEMIQLFDKIEDLSLQMINLNSVESLVQRLPRLRCFKMSRLSLWHIAQVLPILSVCNNLEKMVVEVSRQLWSGDEEIEDALPNINVNFHENFIKAIQNQHLQLEITDRDEVIGFVTAKEIVWRNKLVHYVGYDPIYSQSNLNLLDLANHEQISNDEQKAPKFNEILEYLDLSSLCSLSKVNKKARKLVESFVQQQSAKHGAFIISDEFSIDFNGLRAYGRYVNNLDVKLIDDCTDQLRHVIETYFKNLRKLRLSAYLRIDPHNFIFPSVLFLHHYVFYGYGSSRQCIFHCNVTSLSETCRHLEILEFKTLVRIHATDEHEPHSLYKLKQFKFKKRMPKNCSGIMAQK